jgi:hypothetical protein
VRVFYKIYECELKIIILEVRIIYFTQYTYFLVQKFASCMCEFICQNDVNTGRVSSIKSCHVSEYYVIFSWIFNQIYIASKIRSSPHPYPKFTYICWEYILRVLSKYARTSLMFNFTCVVFLN